MRYYLLINYLLFFSFCFSQNLVNTIDDIAIIGAKQIGDKLILLNKGEQDHLKIMALDKNADVLWENEIKIPPLKGYDFNQVQLLGNRKYLYIIQQLSAKSKIHQIDIKTGDILNKHSVKLVDKVALNAWGMEGNNLYAFNKKLGYVRKYKLTDEGRMEKSNAFPLPEKYPAETFNIHFSHSDNIYSTARVLSKNHRSMHLYLSKFNLATGENKVSEIDLDFLRSSFTYNSSQDRNVYGVIPSATGFYLLGKLDFPFKKDYPTTKVSDGFVGFWIAKFNFNLELEYHSEIPFDKLDYLVSTNTIQKPTIITLKEDLDNGVFVSINEIKGAVHGKKYFIYLDNKGVLASALGSRDAYHFTEYGKKGIKDAGRKNNIRLMGDQWTHTATGVYLHIASNPLIYSEALEQVLQINYDDRKYLDEDKSYNYFQLGDQSICLQYVHKKRGILKIYKK